MAAICKEIEIKRSKAFVWNAIRDVGQIHKRLVPGFVTECRLEGDSRYLTFGNGMSMREMIISIDDEICRHSWSAHGEPLTHYNASAQVFEITENTSRVVWIADLMPHDVAGPISEMIQVGLETMKRTLESA